MSEDPINIPFDQVKMGARVFLPGRREYAEVVDISGAGRRRSVVQVILDSGPSIGYPRAGWNALTSPLTPLDKAPRAKRVVNPLNLPAPRVRVKPSVPNPVRAGSPRHVVRKGRRPKRIAPPAASNERVVSQADLPEIPGPPIPLPCVAKPAKGLWT